MVRLDRELPINASISNSEPGSSHLLDWPVWPLGGRGNANICGADFGAGVAPGVRRDGRIGTPAQLGNQCLAAKSQGRQEPTPWFFDPIEGQPDSRKGEGGGGTAGIEIAADPAAELTPEPVMRKGPMGVMG
eukprot:CAMPEP_0206497748 /NCGR_PEP_ID=MMETSP0324_2-20121206/50455_1 /ASSEMBLY_ACC=CAM_ASM_000836 /TAXON_ID=2866 /ORGANISM="Crypthecodinium cohnii, Strain Seligo" /LENGTH=131 /DNA_ID=CAMNT_0053983547 /DNA_START=171 /DNA_END=566 /DNA_ORIENTATION=+